MVDRVWVTLKRALGWSARKPSFHSSHTSVRESEPTHSMVASSVWVDA